MKSLEQYIEESLLDDIDDLENTSDEIVKDYNTLYGHYDLNYIKAVSAPKLNKYIDKKAIKKLDAELFGNVHFILVNQHEACRREQIIISPCSH